MRASDVKRVVENLRLSKNDISAPGRQGSNDYFIRSVIYSPKGDTQSMAITKQLVLKYLKKLGKLLGLKSMRLQSKSVYVKNIEDTTNFAAHLKCRTRDGGFDYYSITCIGFHGMFIMAVRTDTDYDAVIDFSDEGDM